MRRTLILLFIMSMAIYMTPYKYASEESEFELDVVINLEKNQVAVEEEFEAEVIVKNKSEEEKKLSFNTGQRFDIIILGTKEELLYRWSDDKMFTQALGSVVLEAGEEKSYSAQIALPKKINPGSYKIKGMITADEDIFSQAKIITVTEK